MANSVRERVDVPETQFWNIWFFLKIISKKNNFIFFFLRRKGVNVVYCWFKLGKKGCTHGERGFLTHQNQLERRTFLVGTVSKLPTFKGVFTTSHTHSLSLYETHTRLFSLWTSQFFKSQFLAMNSFRHTHTHIDFSVCDEAATERRWRKNARIFVVIIFFEVESG